MRSSRLNLPPLEGICFATLLIGLLLPTLLPQGTFLFYRNVIGLVFTPFTVISLYIGRKNLPSIGKPAIILFGLWILWQGIATVCAIHPAGAFIRDMDWISTICFGLAAWLFLNPRQHLLPWVLGALIAGFLIGEMQVLIAWHSVEDTQNRIYWWHMLPGFQHIRHIGLHGLAAFGALFYFLLRQESSLQGRISSAIGIAFVSAFFIWTGGRGIVLSALILYCTLICLANKPRQRKRLLTYGIAAMAIGTMASLPYQAPGVGFRYLIERTPFYTNGKLDELSSGRLGIWKNCLETGSHYPLTGIGPDQFRIHPGTAKGNICDAHNFVIQSVIDWGYAGALIFLVLCVCILIFLTKRTFRKERDDFQVMAFAGMWAYGFYGLVDEPFYCAIPMVLIAFTIAIGLRTEGTENLKRTETFAFLFIAASLFAAAMHAFSLYQFDSFYRLKPEPNSVRVKVVENFTFTTVGLWNWIEHWEKDSPEFAAEWYARCEAFNESAWFFYMRDAVFEYKRGNLKAAIDKARKSYNEAPGENIPQVMRTVGPLLPIEIQEKHRETVSGQ